MSTLMRVKDLTHQRLVAEKVEKRGQPEEISWLPEAVADDKAQ
jgi:hypothetical protein